MVNQRTCVLTFALVLSNLGYADKSTIENYLASSEIVSFEVAMPALPPEWRVPTSSDLDHIMRPQAIKLYPDYFAQAYIDNDSSPDWVILAVKKDHSSEGLLAYLTTLNDWLILDVDDFGKSMKVDMTVNIQKCGGKTSLIYSPLGRLGNIYSWDRELREFVKRPEEMNFE